MKKLIIYSYLLPLLAFVWGCKKDNYPGGEISPYIALYDVRNLYKGNDVTLTVDNMMGSRKITCVVVSDHREGNMPAGLLVVQDSRRLSELRGISIPLGAAAANYIPGDSVTIDVEGGVLKRQDGILQLTNITEQAITKVAGKVPIPINRVPASQILANPFKYESTLTVLVKGGFNPLPVPSDVLSGDKIINDGFGDLQMHTESTAAFANQQARINANYYGIIFNKLIGDSMVPQFRIRSGADVVPLNTVIEVSPVLITGFVSDAKGTDANYEYIQFMATRDIDFAATPYAVVTTNNANASTPTGYPAKGWATGDVRTYKFSLTSGTVTKGSFFYVGGTGKTINGSGSTSMASSKWIRAFNYSTTNGDDFGTKTTNLLANSGNAFGMAIFEGKTVTVDSKPADVIFCATGGSLFAPGPPAMGYRIANTDWYDIQDPITFENQPFYRAGTNTLNLAYNTSDVGYFVQLGGEYTPALGRWTKARVQNNVLLSKTSALTEIEGEGATKLK